MIEIKNMPKGWDKYVVARIVAVLDRDRQKIESYDYWFWGSYETEEVAYTVAETISGQVFVRGKE